MACKRTAKLMSNTTSEVPKEIRDKYKSGDQSSMVTPLSSVHGVHVVNKRLSTNNKVAPLGTIPSGLPSEPETTLPPMTSTDPSAESYRAAGKEATIVASDYK
eukprot:CAMPEP_0119043654 /NCGR_PEP_ID=MMETSP1177-20130426/24463_1 /TAXON_ID=2985 /ORGANISM="Ochromonas sp, Strain CCMP1899" /LENGTH=102 /DNA_ID=CAMNT_0007012241 /DNA_START=622 /DNA_END=930 /DNA_ORIENTATION=+